jgi:cytidylate kinase
VKRTRPVIAIDGPVGAGKSTVARELARALGFTYVNTGAMYRAVAVALRDAGVKPDAAGVEKRVESVLQSVRVELDGERITLNGRDISNIISDPEVSDLASRFSALAPVRARMRELQRAAGEKGGVVMEGRDIGTAVFPDAEFKFYLDAQVEVRAERRWAELRKKGIAADREQVLKQLIERDRRDSARELAPLRRADDAIVIDTTGLSITEVVEELKTRVQSGSAVG